MNKDKLVEKLQALLKEAKEPNGELGRLYDPTDREWIEVESVKVHYRNTSENPTNFDIRFNPVGWARTGQRLQITPRVAKALVDELTIHLRLDQG